jgi:hypothetical protein
VVVKLLKSNSNFKEGLSILEYFFLLTVLVVVLRIENSGCRIPTRRLHDVSQELLTLKTVEQRGVEVSALKRMKKWLNH